MNQPPPDDAGRIEPPNLSDRLNRQVRQTANVPLHGDVYVRAIRALTALLGQDPQQIMVEAGADIKFNLSEPVGLQAIVQNLDAAPWRTVGQSFRIPVRVTAGAQFSFAIFGFIPDVNELIVLDWARVSGGAGDINYGICGFVPTNGRSLPYLPEKIATAIAGAGDPPTGDVKRPHLVSLQCHGGATAGALVDGTDMSALGTDTLAVNVTTHIPLEDVVLFPGEAFIVSQLTAALGLNVTLKGRRFQMGAGKVGVFGI